MHNVLVILSMQDFYVISSLSAYIAVKASAVQKPKMYLIERNEALFLLRTDLLFRDQNQCPMFVS